MSFIHFFCISCAHSAQKQQINPRHLSFMNQSNVLLYTPKKITTDAKTGVNKILIKYPSVMHAWSLIQYTYRNVHS